MVRQTPQIRPYIVIRVEELTPDEANRICLSDRGQVMEIPRRHESVGGDEEELQFEAYGCNISARCEVLDIEQLPDLARPP